MENIKSNIIHDGEAHTCSICNYQHSDGIMYSINQCYLWPHTDLVICEHCYSVLNRRLKHRPVFDFADGVHLLKEFYNR